MPYKSLIQEQRDIFHGLQELIDTDKNERDAAQKRRQEKEEETKRELAQATVDMRRVLNEISETAVFKIPYNWNCSKWLRKSQELENKNTNGELDKAKEYMRQALSEVEGQVGVLNKKITEESLQQIFINNSRIKNDILKYRDIALHANERLCKTFQKGTDPDEVSYYSGCASFGIIIFLGVVLGGIYWHYFWYIILCSIALSVGATITLKEMFYAPLNKSYGILSMCVIQITQAYQTWLKPYAQQYQERMAMAGAQYEQTTARLNQALSQNLARLRLDFVKFVNDSDVWGHSWQHTSWSRWKPATTTQPATRIGTFLPRNPLLPPVPAFINCPGGQNLLFKVNGSNASLISAVQSIMLRLLALQPPGTTRFTLIDPVGLGQNVAVFMQLADHDEKLVGNLAWSETKHIEQQLANLSEHMAFVIQKYLRGQFSTIEEYNIQAGEVAEPYRVLVVTGFPAKFSEEAVNRLIEIAENGPRCGVFTIIMQDTARSYDFASRGYNDDYVSGCNYAFLNNKLEQTSVVLNYNAKVTWQDPDYRECQLELDKPPELALFNTILQEVGKASSLAGEVKVPFERVILPESEWWKGKTRDGIRVPLGRAGASKLQYLELGKGTAQHVLVAGKTGAGKTNLLHVLLTNLALTYSPHELELFLIDFKTVGFTPYATFQLPHARVIATQSEREFGLSVLQGLDQQLEQRKRLFSSANVQDIADFRQKKPSERMPRMLLLVDEFQEFFTYDDKVAQEATLLLDRLVRQGRAFGIHVMLGSQTLSGAYTPARTTIGQMAVRIALQCEESDSRLILSDDNSAARLLSRAGEAIYNASNGLVEGNNPFQCAWLPEEELEQYLQNIHTSMRRSGMTLPWQQIVFLGDSNADVQKNRMFNQALAALYSAQSAKFVPAWIGDPIAIKDALTVQFKQQAGNNVLLVGQQDEAALGIQMTMLFCLAASYTKQQMRCYIFDFTPLDYPLAGRLASLQQMLPHTFKIVTRRTLPTAIEEISNAVKLRMDATSPDSEAIYLWIYGLQRIRDLRPDEDMGYSSFSDSTLPPSLSKQFATILREGPELGIHTIAWCDTYANVSRTLDRGTLREFEVRILFQMSADDSTNLIDVPEASKIGLHRAILYNDETGRLEKFIPYGIPSDKWLQDAAALIQQKSAPSVKQ